MRISDWSSDVCSSDLKYGVIGLVTMPWFVIFELLAPFLELFGVAYFVVVMGLLGMEHLDLLGGRDLVDMWLVLLLLAASVLYAFLLTLRSEERRVGEECVRQW